jgi:hypothetical protein
MVATWTFGSGIEEKTDHHITKFIQIYQYALRSRRPLIITNREQPHFEPNTNYSVKLPTIYKTLLRTCSLSETTASLSTVRRAYKKTTNLTENRWEHWNWIKMKKSSLQQWILFWWLKICCDYGHLGERCIQFDTGWILILTNRSSKHGLATCPRVN